MAETRAEVKLLVVVLVHVTSLKRTIRLIAYVPGFVSTRICTMRGGDGKIWVAVWIYVLYVIQFGTLYFLMYCTSTYVDPS